jgi:hypothetical protein
MTRKVTGKLVKSDTTPLSDIYIYFRPLAVMAYTTENEMVSLIPIEVVTDEEGYFETTLYAETDFDTITSQFIYDRMGYRIEIPSLGLIRLVTVPEGAEDIDWNKLGTRLDS